MTIPDYNPNVPQSPGTSFAISQPQLLTNFLQLFNKFAVNHVPLNAATNAGNHTIVELLEQQTPQQTAAGQISVYTKDVVGQTDQVFIKYQGPAGQEFQYSNYQIYQVNGGNPINGQTAFFTFLPGGIIIYFGSFTVLPGNRLNFYPPVAKNIIGMSFCPMNNADFKPDVHLSTLQNGVYVRMRVYNSRPDQADQPAPPCFYCILANIT